MGIKKIHYLVNHIVVMETVNRNTAQFPENKAKKAGVPIVMAGMDFEKKEASISDTFYPTADETADFQHIHQFYAHIQGKIPEQGMLHLTMQPANPII